MWFSSGRVVKMEGNLRAEGAANRVFDLREGAAGASSALYKRFGMLLNAKNQRHPKSIDAKGNARGSAGRGSAASRNAGLSGSEQTQSSSHQARAGRGQPGVLQCRA